MPDLSGRTDSAWATHFPALFAPTYADTDVTLTTAAVPENPINRLHLVGGEVTGAVRLFAAHQAHNFSTV